MASVLNSPFSYRNWKSAQEGNQWTRIWEFPLFARAHFVGEISEGLGPYQLINAVAMESGRPPLFLRIREHLEEQLPSMEKTQDNHYHGGSEADEIAALLSLCLGVRLKAGSATRVFGLNGDPMGRPIGWGVENDPDLSATMPPNRRPILKSVVEVKNLSDAGILATLSKLDIANAISLVRAARMYQEAVWTSETTPELSWIMFVSAIEIVAKEQKVTASTPVEQFQLSRPKLVEILREYGGANGDNLVREVAAELAPLMFSTRKFIDFLFSNSFQNLQKSDLFPYAQIHMGSKEYEKGDDENLRLSFSCSTSWTAFSCSNV